jgi:hypothetical protein
VATGLSPGLKGGRELSVIRSDPRLGILIGIHPPGQPERGWHMWILPNDLEAFVRLEAKVVGP